MRRQRARDSKMDMTEIRDRAADLFATEACQNFPETTPTAITPEMIEWCQSFGANSPQYVPVQQDPCGIYGFCNIGVTEKIRTDGGTIRFGWLIWEYPRVFLTAEFHSVWVSPAGDLTDITPKPGRETQIVFAPDASYLPDFDFLKRPNNRRLRIYRAADTSPLVGETIAGFNASQRAYETRRATKKGMTLEQWVASRRFPIDPLPDLIDSFLCDADERDTLFTPTPIGARCSRPHRALQLGNSMAQKLRQIRAFLGEE